MAHLVCTVLAIGLSGVADAVGVARDMHSVWILQHRQPDVSTGSLLDRLSVTIWHPPSLLSEVKLEAKLPCGLWRNESG